ncbi:LamG domain-containing protein [Streptomyces sp. YIM 98790]|uniref:LamG domain-containing protein n=1 Tax=Streptomyces sp. YIM 98790 TaxID=2689077 RepID=UPI00140B0EF5|nr:LamG domain-containing protein [Streptomyces sp. YIM 98790]
MAAARRWRHGAGAVAALCALVLTATPDARANPDDDGGVTGTAQEGPATEAARASAEAGRTGEQVEVVGERSEYTTVFANPEDGTFTLEMSAVPVRVRDADGGWTEPDATLEVREDGTVGPRAAAARMSFSGGGDRAMASLTRDGQTLTVQWPHPLPEPELDGPSALYREVLPGVDLQVTAEAEGFSHVLVVKTPQAAAQPALRRLEYPLTAEGLTLREGAGGTFRADDANGNAVFQAAPALMWDSAGKAAAAGGAPEEPSAAGAGRSPAARDAAGEGAVAREREPGHADTVAEPETELSQDALTLVPDQKMLTGTPAEAFPLYIDPPVGLSMSRRTLLRSDGYVNYNWGNGAENTGKGTGRCGTWNGYVCSTANYTQRLYFQFTPDALAGKNVLQATFRATQAWSFVCDPRTVDLVRTNGFSSSTKWPGPSHLGTMGSRNVNHGRGTACSPSQPPAPVEFSTSTLTSTVKKFAKGEFSRLNLMLKARSESDTSYWKRFRNDAVLSVVYSSLPDKPTNVGVVTGSGTVCERSSSSPQIVASPNPTLKATVRAAPGGDSMTGRAVFDVDKRNADGTWSNTRTPTERPSTGYVGHGTTMTINWPTTLAEDTLYRYRAWNRAYYLWNDEIKFISSDSTQSSPGWCYFKVDPTAPKAPQISIGAPYAECLPNDCPAAGGPGEQATLTFRAASGDDPVTAIQYRLSTETTWRSATASGSAWTASFDPEESGTVQVTARAKDTVGRWGEQAVFDFLVAMGDGPVARWHFGETTGPAVDSATADGAPQHDATLYGGAARDDRGRRGLLTRDSSGELLPEPVTDRGMLLDGTDDHARTAGPVLETRSPYTVAAWVRLDHKDNDQIILSQDGQQYSPFILAYLADRDIWFFGVKESDEATGRAYFGRFSVLEPQLGVWTHVAGTYDPRTGALTLYVNGRQQYSTAYHEGSWAAPGPLQIGRYQWAGVRHFHFAGSIDEVAVWQRALTREEVKREARVLTTEGYADTELVAAWDPQGAEGGGPLPDAGAGYGRDLALEGGAVLDGEALALNGTDAAGTTPGPVVDDRGSFTVTASVEADGAALAAKPVGYAAQVVGQRTADGSAWGLWFELTGKDLVIDDLGEERELPVGIWHFGRRLSDGTFSSVSSDEPAVLDGEVRLTGTYEAPFGKISLYVGGERNGEPGAFATLSGAGELAVGKGMSDQTWGHHLPGRITDVRVWSGALASEQQVAEVTGL